MAMMIWGGNDGGNVIEPALAVNQALKRILSDVKVGKWSARLREVRFFNLAAAAVGNHGVQPRILTWENDGIVVDRSCENNGKIVG